MQFALIKPATREAEVVQCEDLKTAEAFVHLDLVGVDHGVVAPGIGIVVYEFGLFDPPEKQNYFAINGRLYAGNAVLYAFDERGDTEDLTAMPQVTFFERVSQIEFAIKHGRIMRPEMSVNGVVLWRWPETPPEGVRP